MRGAAPAAADYPHPANQPPPRLDIDLFSTDRPLVEATARAGVDAALEGLPTLGRQLGSSGAAELGRLANDHPPVLRTHDARGERLDVVEFHPAWHAMMALSMREGLHCSTAADGSHAARAARLYMAYQVESGHVCPLTMTHASLAALAHEPRLEAEWAPRILSRLYDPAFRPAAEKSAVTLGMGMTEREGGSDVRTNLSRARREGEAYAIEGRKWFMSAPMCDAFLALAQTGAGPTCFLVPRWRPDGRVNALRFVRLKDKLGNRSNASSEVEFHDAFAERVGADGAGLRVILAMAQLTRLDCVVASAGLMRLALAEALHHARERIVFGRVLAGQPAMRATLADMALEVEAATALAMRLAQAHDRAGAQESEATYARLITPAAKYLVCKAAPRLVHEAMECLGGNGYIEDGPLARAYREAPCNAIWEGSGNVMALDVLRAARRAPEACAALVAGLDGASGEAPALTQALAAPEAERSARRSAERLARLAAAAALAEADGELAGSYRATRLAGEARESYGACDLGTFEGRLLERALPG